MSFIICCFSFDLSFIICFIFFVTFLHFFILCFVICTVSPYVYYYCSLFLCKSVRTLPQGGNSIAVIKYRIISYRILTYVLVLMYHLQVEQRTSVFKSQMLCEASQGIWHVLLPVDGTWVPKYVGESDVYWTVHHCDNWRIKIQLEATCYFIILLIGSTCFGHYYAHHQELATVMLITTLVISLFVCCMLEVRCS